MTVEAIKDVIAHLPDEEKTALASWIIEQDHLIWDKQIEEDFSSGGAGMALLAEAEAKRHRATQSRWMHLSLMRIGSKSINYN